MKKNSKGKPGVITVLVSLMLTGILSLGTLVIEAGRFQAAKTQLSDANISACTSMIALYDKELYERYGLLSMDSEESNIARYTDYLHFNSDLSAGYKGNNISTFYVIESTEMEGLYNLTYPQVLKRQILSRAKYKIIPQDYSLNYYNMNYFLADLQSKASFISEQLENAAKGKSNNATIPSDVQSALANLYGTFINVKKYDEACDVTLSGGTMSLLPSVTGTVEHNAPESDMDLINEAVSDAQSVLGSYGAILASDGQSTYSEVDVSLNMAFITNAMAKIATADAITSNASLLASQCRAMAQGVQTAILMLDDDKEGNLLLNSYIANYFSNRNFSASGSTGPARGTSVTGKENMNFSGACVEYVFAGNASERVNQQWAYDYIMAVRLINNLYSIITTSNWYDANSSSSVAAHIAWAYYETFVDTELLFKHNAVVPFGKNQVILSINNPVAVNSAFAAKDFVGAMRSLGVLNSEGEVLINGTDKTNYRDALALALWFVPNSKKMLRVADLIQLETRYREQYVDKNTAEFLMSNQNTFCRVKCVAKLNSILPVISMGENSGIRGTRLQSVKYVGF